MKMNRLFQLRLNRKYFSFIIKVCLVSILFSILINGQSNSAEKKGDERGIAFLKDMLVNVDVNDAFVAIKVWVDELNKHTNIGMQLKPTIYDNMDDLSKNLNKDKIVMIVCSPLEYLKYNSKMPITPVVFGVGENGISENYVIVTRTKDKISNLTQLKGKKIFIHTGSNSEMIDIWLNVLLNESKLGDYKSFFKELKESNMASQVILSVFFDQYDACIVTKSAFNTMRELNPQVGKSMQVMITSPPFIMGLSCFTNEFMKTEMSNKIINTASDVENYPSGKQIFKLLRMNKLMKFKEEYIDSTRLLLNMYTRIQKNNGEISKK